MKTKETIRAELQAAAERMPRYATAYRGLEQKAFDTVYPLVIGYIRDRFLLTKEMCRSDRLLDLADISLRYMLDLKRMGIDPGEISRSCSGASSVITKKVLLMKAVQELFEVSMTPTEFASIETVTELTEFICRHHLSACNTECSDDKQKTEAEGFDVYAIRENFPALGESIHGQPLCIWTMLPLHRCQRKRWMQCVSWSNVVPTFIGGSTLWLVGVLTPMNSPELYAPIFLGRSPDRSPLPPEQLTVSIG